MSVFIGTISDDGYSDGGTPYTDDELIIINRCQCADPLCPVCAGKCHNRATETLYRVDMEDETGTAFCDACASDAYDSGLFNSETYNDESGDDNER